MQLVPQSKPIDERVSIFTLNTNLYRSKKTAQETYYDPCWQIEWLDRELSNVGENDIIIAAYLNHEFMIPNLKNPNGFNIFSNFAALYSSLEIFKKQAYFSQPLADGITEDSTKKFTGKFAEEILKEMKKAKSVADNGKGMKGKYAKSYGGNITKGYTEGQANMVVESVDHHEYMNGGLSSPSYVLLASADIPGPEEQANSNQEKAEEAIKHFAGDYADQIIKKMRSRMKNETFDDYINKYAKKVANRIVQRSKEDISDHEVNEEIDPNIVLTAVSVPKDGNLTGYIQEHAGSMAKQLNDEIEKVSKDYKPNVLIGARIPKSLPAMSNDEFVLFEEKIKSATSKFVQVINEELKVSDNLSNININININMDLKKPIKVPTLIKMDVSSPSQDMGLAKNDIENLMANSIYFMNDGEEFQGDTFGETPDDVLKIPYIGNYALEAAELLKGKTEDKNNLTKPDEQEVNDILGKLASQIVTFVGAVDFSRDFSNEDTKNQQDIQRYFMEKYLGKDFSDQILKSIEKEKQEVEQRKEKEKQEGEQGKENEKQEVEQRKEKEKQEMQLSRETEKQPMEEAVERKNQTMEEEREETRQPMEDKIKMDQQTMEGAKEEELLNEYNYQAEAFAMIVVDNMNMIAASMFNDPLTDLENEGIFKDSKVFFFSKVVAKKWSERMFMAIGSGDQEILSEYITAVNIIDPNTKDLMKKNFIKKYMLKDAREILDFLEGKRMRKPEDDFYAHAISNEMTKNMMKKYMVKRLESKIRNRWEENIKNSKEIDKLKQSNPLIITVLIANETSSGDIQGYMKEYSRSSATEILKRLRDAGTMPFGQDTLRQFPILTLNQDLKQDLFHEILDSYSAKNDSIIIDVLKENIDGTIQREMLAKAKDPSLDTQYPWNFGGIQATVLPVFLKTPSTEDAKYKEKIGDMHDYFKKYVGGVDEDFDLEKIPLPWTMTAVIPGDLKVSEAKRLMNQQADKMIETFFKDLVGQPSHTSIFLSEGSAPALLEFSHPFVSQKMTSQSQAESHTHAFDHMLDVIRKMKDSYKNRDQKFTEIFSTLFPTETTENGEIVFGSSLIDHQETLLPAGARKYSDWNSSTPYIKDFLNLLDGNFKQGSNDANGVFIWEKAGSSWSNFVPSGIPGIMWARKNEEINDRFAKTFNPFTNLISSPNSPTGFDWRQFIPAGTSGVKWAKKNEEVNDQFGKMFNPFTNLMSSPNSSTRFDWRQFIPAGTFGAKWSKKNEEINDQFEIMFNPFTNLMAPPNSPTGLDWRQFIPAGTSGVKWAKKNEEVNDQFGKMFNPFTNLMAPPNSPTGFDWGQFIPAGTSGIKWDKKNEEVNDQFEKIFNPFTNLMAPPNSPTGFDWRQFIPAGTSGAKWAKKNEEINDQFEKTFNPLTNLVSSPRSPTEFNWREFIPVDAPGLDSTALIKKVNEMFVEAYSPFTIAMFSMSNHFNEESEDPPRGSDWPMFNLPGTLGREWMAKNMKINQKFAEMFSPIMTSSTGSYTPTGMGWGKPNAVGLPGEHFATSQANINNKVAQMFSPFMSNYGDEIMNFWSEMFPAKVSPIKMNDTKDSHFGYAKGYSLPIVIQHGEVGSPLKTAFDDSLNDDIEKTNADFGKTVSRKLVFGDSKDEGIYTI